MHSAALGYPGEYPYTRGIQPTMYRGRLWTMRQYAGFATAEESNQRYRYLLAQGRPASRSPSTCRRRWATTPTTRWPRARWARSASRSPAWTTCARSSTASRWSTVTTSMTINATGRDPARALHRRRQASRARTCASSPARCRTTSSRSTSRAARTSIRRALDAPHHRSLPLLRRARCRSWNTISISGYHIREAGCTAVQEIGFTLANGIAYVQAALDAGLDVDALRRAALLLLQRPQQLLRGGRQVPRGAAHVGADHARALRRAKTRARWLLRFHTQTAGSTLTAQQPDNNIVRTAYQAMAAVLGGTQSLHTNCKDEALALPTEDAGAAGAAHAADPRLRDRRGRHRRSAGRLVLRRGADRRAGARRRGSTSPRSTRSAAACAPSSRATSSARSRRPPTATSASWRSSERIVVGVNRFQQAEEQPSGDPARGSRAWDGARRRSVAALRERRDNAAVGSALAALEEAARGTREPDAAHPRRRRGATPRSARSATRCAASSASSNPSAACKDEAGPPRRSFWTAHKMR